MLRRKLVLMLGFLVALLLLTAVGAIWALQGTLDELGRLDADALRPVAADFRNRVLALSVVFLVVMNVSVLVLLRTAGMVLRPVDALLEATRQLGRERFDYRVQIEQHDEFGELARAYNSLAAQLQANEQRKLETLGQVALTLNHELNNAMSVIELQVQLLSRQSGAGPAAEKYARQIHGSLDRMGRTLDALKHVRRIVLTDYTSGVKMLDLTRSVQEDAPAPPAAADESVSARASS
jgi:signal transduction histidine kinase